jgi:hypothetical protein
LIYIAAFVRSQSKMVYLPKGTRLIITARFDNSPNHPLNPDPGKAVGFGAASETEMLRDSAVTRGLSEIRTS